MTAPNTMPWTRLTVGTMQSIPDLEHQYWIMKVGVGDVLTYQSLKLGPSSWLHLGAHETFNGAKEIVARNWQMGLGND